MEKASDFLEGDVVGDFVGFSEDVESFNDDDGGSAD